MDATTTAGYAEAHIAADSLHTRQSTAARRDTGARHGTDAANRLDRRSVGLTQALACSSAWDREHELHIATLAAGLFRDLRSLHGLGEEGLMLLHCAARLTNAPSLDLRHLLEPRMNALLAVYGADALTDRQVMMVAAIAAHGVGSDLPERDRAYWHLSDADRDAVRWCAAILQAAKGFDADQRGTVGSLLAACQDGELVIVAGCEGDADANIAEGRRAATVLAWKARMPLRVVEIAGFGA
jgi:hypothetical protein